MTVRRPEVLTIDAGEGLTLRELVASEAKIFDREIRSSEERFRATDPEILIAYPNIEAMNHRIRYQSGSFKLLGMWANDEPVGLGSLSIKNESVRTKSCELSYWVAEDHLMQGYASRATRAMKEYAFSRPGVQTVATRVHIGNVASAATSQAGGLRYLGILQRDPDNPNTETDMWRFGAFKKVPKELKDTFADEVLRVEDQNWKPYRSVAWVCLDGVNKAAINHGSDTKYIVTSGEVTFIVDGQAEILRTDDEITIPRGAVYQDVGRATMYAVCMPGFDPEKVEVIRSSTTPIVSDSV